MCESIVSYVQNQCGCATTYKNGTRLVRCTGRCLAVKASPLLSLDVSLEIELGSMSSSSPAPAGARVSLDLYGVWISSRSPLRVRSLCR